jgi:hypothetical protein
MVPKDDGMTVDVEVETALLHVFLFLFFTELPSY